MDKKKKYYMEISQKLQELLTKSEEIEKVLVADLTGQLVGSAGCEKEDEDKTRMLAATFSAIIAAVRSAGAEGDLGDSDSIYVRYDDGIVHISRIGEKGVLAIITTTNANIGAIRLLADRYRKRLAESVKLLADQMETLYFEGKVEENILNL